MKRVRLPVLLGFPLLVLVPIASGGTIVSSLVNPGLNTCAPFGCALTDQEVFAGSDFSGPIDISSLTYYYNQSAGYTGVVPATFTITLSTTSAAVDNLSSNLASNIGTDITTFLAGQPVASNGQINIVGQNSFAYNPSKGNLLIDITDDNGSAGNADTIFVYGNFSTPLFSEAVTFLGTPANPGVGDPCQAVW